MRRDYIQELLQGDEQVLFRTGAVPGRVLFLEDCVEFIKLIPSDFVVFFAAFVLAGLVVSFGRLHVDPSAIATFALWVVVVYRILLVLGVIIEDRCVLRTWEMAITDRRVIAVIGLFSKKVWEMSLSSISSTAVYQSFFGRVFNYGNLSIAKYGRRHFCSRPIYDPIQVRLILDQAVAMDKERKMHERMEIRHRIKTQMRHQIKSEQRLIESDRRAPNHLPAMRRHPCARRSRQRPK